jgi:hypothetical protein
MIVLDIPRATPSLNATRWKHWRVAYREKQLWRTEVRVARIQAGYCNVQAPRRARVTIERYGRALDPDNFVGGLKSLIDSLKQEGLIADDTPEHIELVPRQFKGKPRTVITVEGA